MNIQARKLILIEEFLRVSDEQVLSRLESFFKIERTKATSVEPKPMSLSEFYEMIDQAKSDSDNGNVISHQDLKEKIKTWK
jgi:hypothetical protein